MANPGVADEIAARVLELHALNDPRAGRKRLWSHRNIAVKVSREFKQRVGHVTVKNVIDRASTTPTDPVEAQRLKTDNDRRRQEHINAVKELAFRDYLAGLVGKNVPPMPAPPPRSKAKPTKGHQRFPMLSLTDWHFEERVSAAGVLGLNSYDIETACRRVWRVVHSCRDWKRDAEAGGRFQIPELTVALMGDFLTGTLHGLEKHSDAPNVVRAALACGDLIALALADLSRDFEKVTVVGVCGNHGRLPDQKKVPTKDPTRSWDYLAYEVARRRLAHNPAVSWHLPEAYGVLFEVGNHLCYAAHGNFIPNNLGVVGYGIRRFTSSLASNLQAAGRPLKYAFFGHWHAANSSEFAGIEATICPSLIGTQEYGFLSGGSVNRSAQELFIFDKELGLVTRERLYGDGPGYDGTYELQV